MDLNCGINCASGVYAVPDGTRNLSTISLPGTAVPGYRLFRPYGTGPARLDIVPFYRRPFVSLQFVLVVEAERELYLAGGIGIRGCVSAEACSIGDGAIGLLKVCGVEDVEGFDTELQLARF
jgi:hypothetical protein